MAELDKKRRKARATAASGASAAAAMPPPPPLDRMWRSPIDKRPVHELLARPGASITNTKEYDPVENFWREEENHRRIWGPVDYKLRLLKAIRFRDLPTSPSESLKSMLCAPASRRRWKWPTAPNAPPRSMLPGQPARDAAAPPREPFPQEYDGIADKFDRLRAIRIPDTMSEREHAAKLKAAGRAARRVGNHVASRPYQQGRR